MNFLLQSVKPFLYTLASVLVLTLLVTLLNYINVFGHGLLNVSKIVIPVISLGLGGYLIGRKSAQKGWLSGLRLSLMFLLFLLLFNFLALSYVPKWNDLIYYVIMVIACILGSMVGINTKK